MKTEGRKEAGLGSTKPRSARGILGCSWLRAQLEKAGAGMWWGAEWSLLIKATEIVGISKEGHSYKQPHGSGFHPGAT